MGNSSGKDKQKKTDQVDQAAPELQKLDEKTKVEVKADEKVKKGEEKARQAAEALKQSAAVQEGEKKLKEAAKKAEEAAKEAAKKAEESAKAAKNKVEAKVEPAAKKIEAEVKKVEADVKGAADKAKAAFDANKINEQAKAAAQEFGQNFNKRALDISSYLVEVEKISCKYYGQVRDEVAVINHEVPLAIATFKRNYVLPVDRRIRAVGHYGLTGLTFLACLQARRGFFSTVKITGIVGLTTGFFFHPEPLNPFRRQNFPEEEHEHDSAEL